MLGYVPTASVHADLPIFLSLICIIHPFFTSASWPIIHPCVVPPALLLLQPGWSTCLLIPLLIWWPSIPVCCRGNSHNPECDGHAFLKPCAALGPWSRGDKERSRRSSPVPPHPPPSEERPHCWHAPMRQPYSDMDLNGPSSRSSVHSAAAAVEWAHTTVRTAEPPASYLHRLKPHRFILYLGSLNAIVLKVSSLTDADSKTDV